MHSLDFYKQRIKDYKKELKQLENPEYVKEYIESCKRHCKAKIQLFEEKIELIKKAKKMREIVNANNSKI